ncbi:hypothetical protein QUF72_04360 [Desulfobacterales bacterium HSG2]|nr:hypothetical protein [Desulfobacterales bacterium HSG2]
MSDQVYGVCHVYFHVYVYVQVQVQVYGMQCFLVNISCKVNLALRRRKEEEEEEEEELARASGVFKTPE